MGFFLLNEERSQMTDVTEKTGSTITAWKIVLIFKNQFEKPPGAEWGGKPLD